jgi:hypothetical protein
MVNRYCPPAVSINRAFGGFVILAFYSAYVISSIYSAACLSSIISPSILIIGTCLNLYVCVRRAAS